MSNNSTSQVPLVTYPFENEYGNTTNVILNNVLYITHGRFASVHSSDSPFQIRFHFSETHSINRKFEDQQSLVAAIKMIDKIHGLEL